MQAMALCNQPFGYPHFGYSRILVGRRVRAAGAPLASGLAAAAA